jgi:hypothetical protein
LICSASSSDASITGVTRPLVVDQAKRGQSARTDPERLRHALAGREAETAGRTDARMQGLEIDRLVFVDGDEAKSVLLVLEEEIFRKRSGHRAT